MKNLGIYVHIPFCQRKCYYCDFYSIKADSSYYEKYFDSLNKQILSYKEKLNDYVIDAIYIGGGTPSVVPPWYISEILDNIYEMNIDKNISTTIEMNPGTVSENKISEYKKIGINRVSVGLQSFDDNILKKIGRIHNSKEFIQTYELLKKYNFEDINVDIMFSLPDQTLEILESTLAKLLEFDITGISAYSLIIEEGTKIANMYKEGVYKETEDELDRKMYNSIIKNLKSKGFIQYEISNFAKRGFASKHNLKYWNMDEYLGFGANAHSYFNNKRFNSADRIDDYILNPSLEYNIEIMDDERKMKDFMMLGFRKTKGINVTRFKNLYNKNLNEVFKKEIKKLINLELITKEEDYYKLTSKGMDFANLVFMEFI